MNIKGTNGNTAEVTSGGQLVTAAVSRDVVAEAAVNSQAFSWCFTGYDYDAADTVMFLQNDNSSKNLIITSISLYSDTASKVQVHKPTGSATPTGTAIVGVNLNVAQPTAAEATAIQDETGFATQGTILINKYTAANGTIQLIDSGCIVLGYKDKLGVDIVTAGTMAYGQIIGYYE